MADDKNDVADDGSFWDSEVELMGVDDSDVYGEPKKKVVEFSLEGKKASPPVKPKEVSVPKDEVKKEEPVKEEPIKEEPVKEEPAKKDG